MLAVAPDEGSVAVRVIVLEPDAPAVRFRIQVPSQSWDRLIAPAGTTAGSLEVAVRITGDDAYTLKLIVPLGCPDSSESDPIGPKDGVHTKVTVPWVIPPGSAAQVVGSVASQVKLSLAGRSPTAPVWALIA